jgi:hypothetical protein
MAIRNSGFGISASRRSALIFSLIMLLAACTQEPLPTLLPVAALPTDTPEITSLPPTFDTSSFAITPSATSLPATPESPASPTSPPLPTATSAPARPSINITVPDVNTDIILGSDIVARGLVTLGPAQTAWLSLITLDGRTLQEAQALVQDISWESGFTVPEIVGGVALLRATVRNENGEPLAEHEVPIHLVLNTETMDRYLALFRPVAGDNAMAGFNLFFDGRAQRPVNNTVTISVWIEECQTQVARQSFVLRGSGYWQGFVIIPSTVAGPGCAIAYFGSPEEETRREVHIPVQILANDDEEARGIVIGNPPADSSVVAGGELLIYGTAINASEESVEVSILLENGRIVNQSSTETDYWGYWELPVLIPFDVEGPAVITAAAGDPAASNYAETQTLILINPAPTPAP